MMPRKRQILIELQNCISGKVYRFRDEVYVAIDIDEPKQARNFYAWDAHLDEIEAHLINEHSVKRSDDALPPSDTMVDPMFISAFLPTERTVLMAYDDEIFIVKPLDRQKFLANEKQYETDITTDVPRKRLLMIEG